MALTYYIMCYTSVEATISLLKNKIFKIISNVQMPRKILMISEVDVEAKM